MNVFRCLALFLIVASPLLIRADDTFKNLVSEYLERNFNVRLSKSKIAASQADRSIYKSSEDVNINFSLNYLNNNLDSPTIINFAAGETREASLTFSKFFSFGTTMIFENTFSSTIQDPTRILRFGGDPEVAEFQQVLTLSQSLSKNFLGKSYKLGLRQNDSSVKVAERKFDLDAQNGVGAFSKAYIKLMQSRDFLNLQKEAYERAKKRKNLIDKRVRDGLSLKVEGLQSEIQLLGQKEQLEQAKQDFSKSKVNLGKLLHRDIGDGEKILKFGEGMSFIALEDTFDTSNNPRIKLINSQLKTTEIVRDLARNNKRPDVDFVLRYQTNDFDAESSEVFEKGNLSGDRNFLTVAITATLPFGNIKAKKELQKAKINNQNLNYQLAQVKRNILQEYKEISRQLEITKENVESSNQSIILSKKTLSEYNKLYRLGKVSLDQVFNAEQLLISNQKKYIGYLAAGHIQKVDLLLFSGGLVESIVGEK